MSRLQAALTRALANSMGGTTPSADERWRAKKVHYQDPEVVASYDATRFRGWHGRGATERKWRAIRAAMGAEFASVRTVLDLPCGTGRFTTRLLGAEKSLVNADVSQPMLAEAGRVARGWAAERGHAASAARYLGAIRCEAERLPFADRSFDAVLSIRFLFHTPCDVRAQILREYARVSRRWIVLDLRHGETLAALGKRAWARVRGARPPVERPSFADLASELERASLAVRGHVFLSRRWSEKVIVVCETRA